MSLFWNLWFIFYFILNSIAFTVFKIDKRNAQKGRYRISEKNLLTLAFFGPFGAILSMKYFKHKTQKMMFRTLVPAFALIHVFFAVQNVRNNL